MKELIRYVCDRSSPMAIRTPGLPVIQVVAHSHPRLLAVATLARHSIRTPGLPVIQVLLAPTLAFLQSPPWPGTAFAQEGFQSFKLSHQCCQLFLLCSLSPSPSCCHPGQARLTPVLPVIPVMFTPTSPVSHSSDAHSDPRLLVVATLAAHSGNMHAPGREPSSAQVGRPGRSVF